MNARESGTRRCRCLRVLPRPRGSWIVATEQAILSEHPTATEAENAALARLRDGDELLIVDRYHRCHRRARPELVRSSSHPQLRPQG
jgi:hypothetical protein